MLAEAIDSVLDQTFTDIEVIVVSTGESAEMRDESHAVASISGCRYFVLTEGSVAAARNAGIARAEGEWIAFLDDDDVWLPGKLERQIDEGTRTGADMVSCDYVTFALDGREAVQRPRPCDGWSHLRAISHFRWWAHPSAVVVRKSALDDVGGFDPGQRYGEDDDLWRRILWRHTVHHVEEALMRCRQGHASRRQHRRRRDLYDLRLFAKMQLDTPRHLRSQLPSFAAVVPRRIAGIVSGDWMLRDLPVISPRTS
jgi:glycosyltransferase involved in cell wall biosynthesis